MRSWTAATPVELDELLTVLAAPDTPPLTMQAAARRVWLARGRDTAMLQGYHVKALLTQMVDQGLAIATNGNNLRDNPHVHNPRSNVTYYSLTPKGLAHAQPEGGTR